MKNEEKNSPGIREKDGANHFIPGKALRKLKKKFFMQTKFDNTQKAKKFSLCQHQDRRKEKNPTIF